MVNRVIGRLMAHELSEEEVRQVSGGDPNPTISADTASGPDCRPDDCEVG
ncbi:hypothetical protein DFR29_11271 [Tahibacter aquaticus]|jgi:hypothetical protein|uniref:Uncharacterized protein n=1 Tax=Tahibacter aquaticus TaxID=520092 RepID=A0A4R6YRL2_9GAMM|nr:hypothetical protein [Tahibacter aquaticus]TDR40757.1 hypothetical protein DFR29_11271 [Tahibacter aquaticus]